MRFIEHFIRSAQQWPERIFLVDPTGERSHAQALGAAWAFAHALRARGILPGSKVALYGSNSADLVEAMLGILCAECVWVPINAMNTAAEAASYLGEIGADVLLYADGVADAVEEIRGLVSHRLWCYPIEAKARLAWVDPERDDAIAPTAINFDQPVSIMSSGGTTGNPKGILIPERSWSMGLATLEAHYPGEFPVYLVAAPLSHAAGGLALMLLGRGVKLVILPGFDAKAVMSAVATHRITQMFLPPTAIYMMLADPDHLRYDYSSLKYFMYAGAPMSPQKLREAVQAFGPVMTQFYAQMECHASITCLSADHHVQALDDPDKAKWLASAGKATKYVRVEFMDPNGNLLPAGERGEIVVRSPLVCSGYVGKAVSRGDERADGWHHTGDVGYRDDDGFIYIVDRIRDIIISGGFNVYPTEVEHAILAHPSIQDCAVVGVPDDKWGEAVTAVVELKAGHHLTPDELIGFCRKTLSSVKTPKQVMFVDALPRSAVGKVLRRSVRERFWQDQSRRI